MGSTITFRRGENDPTSGSGLTLAEPAFNTTLKTFHIGLGHGVTAAWVGAPISGLSADIAAGITYKIPSAAAVKNYIGGLCYGNTGAPTITQYVSSFNGLTGAVGGVCAAQANTFTALQSFANGISASGITVNGNMSVTGNFTVSGGVTFTTSETVLIEDNIITLNSNVTGSPSENAGIEIERGTSANVQLLWNESSDRWTFTNDGSTYYDLPTSVVTSFNGLTGAVTGVTVGGVNTFTALNSFNAGISSAGGTFTQRTRFSGGLEASGITATTVTSQGISTISGYPTYASWTSVSADTINFVFDGVGGQILRPTDDNIDGAVRTNYLPASSGTLALTSQLMGAVNGSTAATTAVTSFNGRTGAVTGVTVGGVNTFTQVNTFSAGISAAGGTFSALTIFTAGLSAAGGATFSDQVRFTSGLSASEVKTLNLSGNGTLSPSFTDGQFRLTQFFGTHTTVAASGSTDRTITLPDDSGTVALTSQLMGAVNGSTAATTAVTSFNGLTGAVTGVTVGGVNTFTQVNTFSAGISAAGGTFSALTIFTAGLSAAGGVTFAGDIAVNGGDITTTATTATVFNSTATTLSVGGANNATVNIGNGSGVTLNIGTGSLFGGVKNINIGSNASFGTSNIAIGNNIANVTITGSQLVVGSPFGGMTLSAATVRVAGAHTISGAGTVEGLLTANGGLSAAEGTFSALARFTSGISAAGGATFSGTITGATATFSRLTTHSAGITTSSLYVSGGATFGGNITLPAMGSINAEGGILYIGDDVASTTRVIIGDAGGSANSTYIQVRDNASVLDIINPFGAARMGDPDGINYGAHFTVDNSSGAAEIAATEVSVNGLLKPLLGISASGGVTFGGTVASDTGYRITANAINAQTGTTYTFLSSDNGKIVTFSNASAVTVTIPTALPVGFNCTAIQLGAGQVGFTAASGLTMNSYGNQYRLIGQHASASIIEYSTNIVNLSGNLVV